MHATLDRPVADPGQLAAQAIDSIPDSEFDALFMDTPSAISRDEAIRRIKAALERRSGEVWHVYPQGKDGLRIRGGYLKGVLLADLLWIRPLTRVEVENVYVGPGRYRDEYVARAEGRQPEVYGGILNHPTIRDLARSQGWT